MQRRGKENRTPNSPIMKKKNDVFLNPYSFTALFYIIPAAIKGTIHSAKLDKIYIILKADPKTFL